MDEGSPFCFNCGEKVEQAVIKKEEESDIGVNDSSFSKIKTFGNSQFEKLKESTSNLSWSTKDFVETTGDKIPIISSKFNRLLLTLSLLET